MAVNLSSLGGAAAQFFTDDGVPLTGGKLYTYAAGTTTPQTTYTSSSGAFSHSNPIVLDAAGRVPGGEIWLTVGTEYKFILKTSTDVTIATYDNLYAISDFAPPIDASEVTYTPPYTSSVATTVEAKLGQIVSVKDFGAVGDAVTNDRAAFALADVTGTTIEIPEGNYVINASITLSAEYSFADGATLIIPNGVTVTFNGGISAGLYQIFNCQGTGAAAFDPAKTEVGYPEWWGAVVGGADCLDAISACVVACRVTQLQCSDYYISSTLKLQTRSRTLRGAGFNYLGNDTGSATRLIVSGGTNATIQMGPDTEPPGGINDFLTEVTVQNLQVARNAAPVAGSNSSGIRNQFTLYSYIEKVKAAEHSYGFHYVGTVQAHSVDCYSFRSTAGTGGGADLFYGYYIDGISADIGASGGNASLYLDTCNATSAGSAPANRIGCYLDGKFTDAYIANCELNNMAFGIGIIGDSNTSQNYSALDLQITSCVLDVFNIAGIYVKNVTKYGAISINGGYCAPAGGAATVVAGLYFADSYGQVSVTDFQTICTPNALCSGIVAINASNIETKTMIVDAEDIAVTLSSVTNSRFLDHVTNYSKTTPAALQMASSCSRNYCQIFAAGKASGFSLGYQLIGTTSTYNELNCTGLDANAVATGSGNKLVYNSTQITSVGTFGTGNYASGVMT